MKSKTYKTLVPQVKFLKSAMTGLAAVCIMMCGHDIQAQTLQLRYTFEDGPGTTTTDDSSSAVYPVTLNMVNSGGAAADLHGPANSGVQNQGTSLNLSTNNPAGNVKGAYAFVTNNATLGNLGVVSNFTATIWVKMSSLNTNLSNAGTRLFVLATNGVTDDGVANTIGINIQSGTGPIPNAIAISVGNNSYVTAPIYYNFPTNVWLFIAMTYDSVSGNAEVYYGSEASPAKLYAVKNIGAGTNFNFSGSASLSIGNNIANAHGFPGSVDEFRFYTGTGDANFIENVRQSSTPVVISSLTPDGSVLMEGTNTLSFTASSANGINTSGIKVAVNGTDVSSSLVFGGTSTSRTVSYANLPVSTTLIQQTNLNNVAVNIQVTDNSGIVTSNSYVYDAFASTNFIWECEDYDFGGGLYIDNPVYAFVTATNTYYMPVANPSYVNLTDANDNGNASGPNRVYRDTLGEVETEYSIGGGINGGISPGELMRQKVLDALALDPTIRDVNVGYFDYGTGSGLPNWMNYTRTYPTGTFNVYLRAADGGGTLNASLDKVISGWGTSAQTLTNLGTFSMANSGGWDSFAWMPLRDANGNLAKVTLSGTNTIRLTAGSGGGGNVNFLMLTPANTNLPAISNIYPNGTNMFQPFPTFSFTASSPAGVTINTNSIKVQLTVSNLLGQGFVTNLTATNGLTITGATTNRTVSAVLSTNSTYTAVISVIDANGSSAGNTVSFDTINPTYTWEAEDYDYADGNYFDNPQTGDYASLSADPGVDSLTNGDANLSYAYRGPGGLGDQADSDSPPRLQYIGTGAVSYNVGWYDTGDWGNYTRHYPAGTFNMFMRAANGSGGALSDTVAQVASGLGTTNQTTTNLGTFTIPTTGNWQGYEWVPLRDAGGNLVKLTLSGALNTFRVTANSGGGGNANFYALFPANTNLPTMSNVYPDGTAMSQTTNIFSFNVQSAVGVSSNSVVVTVNGITVSNLVFSGSLNNWNVSYPHLQPNSPYVITVTVTDVDGNVATISSTFDTMNPNNYTWEAEDFDYDGGLYIDNPQTNAYAGLGAVTNVDTVQVNFNATAPYVYRTNSDALPDDGPGMSTEFNGDIQRAQYVGTGFTDYSMGFFSDGAWANYTRHYPAGSYNVYGRLASGGATASEATLSVVTSGWGTMTQTTNWLGTFNIPTTGWESYTYVPMRDENGNLVTLTFNGSTNTLQLARPGIVGDGLFPDVNANFLMLVPLFTASASHSGANVVISFPTVSGFKYQVQYKTNLTDSSWTLLGSPLAGNDAVESVNDLTNVGTRFYRVQIQ